MLIDVLTELKKQNLRYDDIAAIANSYMESNTPNMHKNNNKSNKLTKIIEKLKKSLKVNLQVENPEKMLWVADFQGNRKDWLKCSKRFDIIPKLTKPMKVLDFIQGSTDEEYEEGKPKEKRLPTL
jgi:hypothetical protein